MRKVGALEPARNRERHQPGRPGVADTGHVTRVSHQTHGTRGDVREGRVDAPAVQAPIVAAPAKAGIEAEPFVAGGRERDAFLAVDAGRLRDAADEREAAHGRIFESEKVPPVVAREPLSELVPVTELFEAHEHGVERGVVGIADSVRRFPAGSQEPRRSVNRRRAGEGTRKKLWCSQSLVDRSGELQIPGKARPEVLRGRAAGQEKQQERKRGGKRECDHAFARRYGSDDAATQCVHRISRFRKFRAHS
jgi:hypothetical protein